MGLLGATSAALGSHPRTPSVRGACLPRCLSPAPRAPRAPPPTHTRLAAQCARSFHPLLTAREHARSESRRPIRGPDVIGARPAPQQWIS